MWGHHGPPAYTTEKCPNDNWDCYIKFRENGPVKFQFYNKHGKWPILWFTYPYHWLRTMSKFLIRQNKIINEFWTNHVKSLAVQVCFLEILILEQSSNNWKHIFFDVQYEICKLLINALRDPHYPLWRSPESTPITITLI